MADATIIGPDAVSLRQTEMERYLGKTAGAYSQTGIGFDMFREFASPSSYHPHIIMSGGEYDPKSYAASVLLRNEYSKHDSDNIGKYDWKRWLMFRSKYLRRVKRESGELVCEYCGKRNLHMDSRMKNKFGLATIDHVRPLSHGAGRYDVTNLAVACYPCNQKKGAADYTMRLMRMRSPFKYVMLSIKLLICKFLRFLSRS